MPFDSTLPDSGYVQLHKLMTQAWDFFQQNGKSGWAIGTDDDGCGRRCIHGAIAEAAGVLGQPGYICKMQETYEPYLKAATGLTFREVMNRNDNCHSFDSAMTFFQYLIRKLENAIYMGISENAAEEIRTRAETDKKRVFEWLVKAAEPKDYVAVKLPAPPVYWLESEEPVVAV